MHQPILQPLPLLRVYSPFGVVLEGRTYTSESDYRYGFNGKEIDDEGMGGGGQTYDYGFRIYNPGLAKFLSVDPLSASYPWYSPYHYAGNCPILFIDLDGAEPFLPILGMEPILAGSNEILIMEGASKTIIRSPEVRNVGRYTAENTSKYDEVLSRTVEQTKETLKNGEKSTKSSREVGQNQHKYHAADKFRQGETANEALKNLLRPDSWTKWLNHEGKWVGRLTEFKPHNIESINRAVRQMSKYLEQLIKENPQIEEWIQIIETYTVTPLIYNNPTTTLTINISYTIQSGETLTKIAANFNTTVEELVKLNGINDPNKINVNQSIVVKQEIVTESL
jgi:RHS repeat-associated protein